MLTKNSLANEKNLKTTDEDFYTNILLIQGGAEGSAAVIAT